VQTCEATAGLILRALDRCTGAACPNVDEVIAETLRRDPPVRSTRRVGPGGGVVTVDLTGLPFGRGPHACPGRTHAVALTAGMEGVTCSS
jgi:cytochrome P450